MTQAGARSTAGRPPARPLVVGLGVVVSCVLPGFLVASLATRLDRDFAFGTSTLGLTIAAFYVISAAGSTPAGRFVDRAGALNGVRWAAGLSCSAALGIALFADSSITVAALLLVAGAGNALAGPAGGALMSDGVPDEHQGLALGLMQAGAPLGAVLAGLALPLVAIPLGWRWAFALAAGVALACGLGASAPKRRLDAATAATAAAPAVPVPVPMTGAPADRGAVVLLALVAGLASAATMGMVAFLVVLSVANGMSESFAGMALAISSLAAATGRIVLGRVADRGRRDPLRLVAVLLAGSTGGYLLLMTATPAGVLIGALAIGAIGWSWPGALSLAAVRRGGGAPAWAVGVLMTGLFTGAIIGPVVVGHGASHGDGTLAWLMCAAIAAAAAGTAALAARRAPAPAV